MSIMPMFSRYWNAFAVAIVDALVVAHCSFVDCWYQPFDSSGGREALHDGPCIGGDAGIESAVRTVAPRVDDPVADGVVGGLPHLALHALERPVRETDGGLDALQRLRLVHPEVEVDREGRLTRRRHRQVRDDPAGIRGDVQPALLDAGRLLELGRVHVDAAPVGVADSLLLVCEVGLEDAQTGARRDALHAQRRERLLFRARTRAATGRCDEGRQDEEGEGAGRRGERGEERGGSSVGTCCSFSPASRRKRRRQPPKGTAKDQDAATHASGHPSAAAFRRTSACGETSLHLTAPVEPQALVRVRRDHPGGEVRNRADAVVETPRHADLIGLVVEIVFVVHDGDGVRPARWAASARVCPSVSTSRSP